MTVWRTLAAGLLATALSPAVLDRETLAAGVETRLEEALRAELATVVPPGARIEVSLTPPFEDSVDAVRDLSHDPRTGHLRALVESGGRMVEVRGKAEIMIDVPVPVRRILPGDVIEDADLASLAVPLERVGDTMITDRSKLIGMASRRQLSPGRLIQTSAVGAPVVVERNKPVELVFVDGSIHLSARGRALQDGGVGDTVRVMNVASNAVVSGTITGPRTVSVGGATPRE